MQFCFYFILGNSLENEFIQNEVLELNNLQQFYEATTESAIEKEFQARKKIIYTEYNDALEKINQYIIANSHKETKDLEHTLEVLKNIFSTIDPLLKRHIDLRMKLLDDLEEAVKYAQSKLPKFI